MPKQNLCTFTKHKLFYLFSAKAEPGGSATEAHSRYEAEQHGPFCNFTASCAKGVRVKTVGRPDSGRRLLRCPSTAVYAPAGIAPITTYKAKHACGIGANLPCTIWLRGRSLPWAGWGIVVGGGCHEHLGKMLRRHIWPVATGGAEGVPVMEIECPLRTSAPWRLFPAIACVNRSFILI